MENAKSVMTYCLLKLTNAHYKKFQALLIINNFRIKCIAISFLNTKYITILI